MIFTNNKGTKLGTTLSNGLPINKEQTPMLCPDSPSKKAKNLVDPVKTG